MAVDSKSVDVTAKTFPFQQTASFNASRYTAVPWGQALVNEEIETPSVGAGDEGNIIIDVELPSDYVAMLRNFHLQIHSTSAINWDNTMLGLAYQNPGGPYKSSVAEYPDKNYVWYQLTSDDTAVYDRFNSIRYFRNYLFGFNKANILMFSDSYDPTQLPLWIPPTVDSSFKQRQVTIYSRNESASQDPQNMSLQMSFDLFTFEQAYSAAVMSSPRTFS